MRIALVVPEAGALEGVASLMQARGHEILSFSDGRDALDRLGSDTSIDALITTVNAGSISGIELCWETRLLAGRQRAIYTLLVAPASEETARVEALDAGADDVMDEPVHPSELLAKLRMAERMLSLQRKLIRSATIDPLSGALNRGAFFEEAAEACNQRAIGKRCAFVLLDLDCLKKVNDCHGHDVGDRAIRAVACVARKSGSIVGRLGGDELGILLKDCGLAQAQEFAADLQRNLCEMSLDTVEGPIAVTCSFGVTEFEPGDTADEVMKRADVALYRAKAQGRNRVAAQSSASMSKQPRQTNRFRSAAALSQEVRERRRGQPASDGLLGRVCAVIDLLVASGLSEEIAIQTMAQRVASAGIPFPQSGQLVKWGDYLGAWRAAFREGAVSSGAMEEYRTVVSAISSIPPQSRVDCVLENDLWNRRRTALRRAPTSVSLLH